MASIRITRAIEDLSTDALMKKGLKQGPQDKHAKPNAHHPFN